MTALAGLPARSRAVAALVGCLAVLAAAPATAQRVPDRAGTSLTLEVARLEAIVTDEQPLQLRARVSNEGRFDREGLRILATVHRAPIGRFNYQQAMDRGVLGDVIHGFSTDIDPVPARGSRNVDLVQTAAELGLTSPANQQGVYPLRLQLLSAGEVVDEVTTNLVFTRTQVELPISVSLLLPIAMAPSRDGQGAFDDTALIEAVEPDGYLGDLSDTLGRRPRLHVTLGVDALVLEEIADLASGFVLATDDGPSARSTEDPTSRRAAAVLSELRETAGRSLTHVLALPYASADLVALQRHGLSSELARHVTDGARSVESVTGDRPLDTIAWPPDGVDNSTLVTLRGLGTRMLVLSEERLRLPGPRGQYSPSPVRPLRASPGTAMPVLVPDPWLEQTLVDDELDPPLAAQRILGEVATVYFEQPGRDDRGLLLAPPQASTLEPGLLGLLADGLADAPFVDVVTLTTLSRAVEAAEESVGLAYAVSERLAELPIDYLAELRDARRALGSLDGVLVDDRATPARFDRLLLQAASIHYRSDLEAGRALLETITGTVEDLYSAVEVPPVPPVTLTSVDGQLPVSVRSNADVPLRVLLHLRTASYEIDGGPTREIVLEPGTSELLTFEVTALRPGRTDGIQVVITDIDGVVELAEGTVVVRSTAFSVAGVVVTAGAALFLIGWGVRETARRRHRSADGGRDDRTSRPSRAPARSRG